MKQIKLKPYVLQDFESYKFWDKIRKRLWKPIRKQVRLQIMINVYHHIYDSVEGMK